MSDDRCPSFIDKDSDRCPPPLISPLERTIRGVLLALLFPR